MTDEAAARDRLIGNVRATQERWRRLVADVPRDRMEQPGAMGDWTFKDVALHLTGWRRRTIRRLTATVRNQASGLSAPSSRRGRSSPRTKASWTTSSASATLPVTAMSCPSSRRYDAA